MNTVERRHSPVYRQLEAYEESWKREHDEAMECQDWEDALAVGLAIYHMLWSRQDAWRDQVFRGVVPYSEEDDRDHQARLTQWLATTKEALSNVLPELEKRFGKVEGAAELRRCAETIEAVLSAWVPPRLSTAVGLREQTLSPEAAAEFDRILQEARSNPPSVPAGPIPREISAEDFFALLKRPGS
jgi:hypothetical protein